MNLSIGPIFGGILAVVLALSIFLMAERNPRAFLITIFLVVVLYVATYTLMKLKERSK